MGKIIALITARGGSKGLPGKNIMPMLGMPLIGWSIKAALDSPLVDECYVSSNDSNILRVAENLGAKLIERPEALATDLSSSEEVINHFISILKDRCVECDDILLLQPTSPIRTSEHIGEAIKEFKERGAECIISVFEPKHSPAKAFKQAQDGRLTGMINESAPYTSRQLLPRALQPNGAIYLFKVNAFLREKGIPKFNVYPYLMSEEDSIDIDDLDDFKLAESILRKRHETSI